MLRDKMPTINDFAENRSVEKSCRANTVIIFQLLLLLLLQLFLLVSFVVKAK
jgi:hypothetical protein